MIKRYSVSFGIVFLCFLSVTAKAYADCESECELPYSCQTLIECRVAKMRCLDSCRQREAWIKLIQAVEKFTFSLAKHLEESSKKLDSLKEDISAQDDRHNRQISELSGKIDAIKEYLMPPETVEPAEQEQNQ